jgi:hypothetical protein
LLKYKQLHIFIIRYFRVFSLYRQTYFYQINTTLFLAILTLKHQYFIIKMNVGVINYTCTGLDKPQGLQEAQKSKIFRQAAHKGGKVVSRTQSGCEPREDPWHLTFRLP